MNILLVEDEPLLRDGVSDLLRGAGHSVTAVGDGPSALKRGTEEPFDLVVLDLMLPGMDGIEVCDGLRTARPGLPILMLTARGSEEEKVLGLRTGADDYVTKPFGARELLARIEALARRAQGSGGAERIEVDGCLLDLGRCEARRGKKVHPLTAREAGILRWLHRHRDRAVSRAELLQQVWGLPGSLETRTVDMAIANLRQKIERDPSRPRIVVSVKGVGYAWSNACA
jgi:DNA-binding response OmpR family regulator